MITTYYRGYRLHIFADRVDIWYGADDIESTTTVAEAEAIIDSYHQAA